MTKVRIKKESFFDKENFELVLGLSVSIDDGEFKYVSEGSELKTWSQSQHSEFEDCRKALVKEIKRVYKIKDAEVEDE